MGWKCNEEKEVRTKKGKGKERASRGEVGVEERNRGERERNGKGVKSST